MLIIWCLVDLLKMKSDQDLCKNLWHDLNKLLWQAELNPRVRCAFGNVFKYPLSLLFVRSQNWKENMRCMQNFAIPTQIMNESAQCICTESLSNPVPPMFPPTHTCATTLFELKTKTKSSHQRRVRSASRQWTWSDKKVPISVIGIRSATHFPPFSFFSQCCYAHHSFSLGAWRNYNHWRQNIFLHVFHQLFSVGVLLSKK